MNGTGTQNSWLRTSVVRALELERAGTPATGETACRIIKSEPATLVWRDRRAADDAAVVCKMYRRIRPMKRLRERLSRSPVEREFTVLARLHRAGIPCSEPLLWRTRYTAGDDLGDILVMREILDAETLEQVAGRGKGALDALDLTALFRLVRRMHACGVYHGALALRNVLHRQTAREEDTFFLIDTRRSLAFPCDIAEHRMGRRDLLWLCMYIGRYAGTTRLPEWLRAYGLAPAACEEFMRTLHAQRSSRGRRNLVNTEFSLRAWIANRRTPPGGDWLHVRLPDRPGCRLDLHYRVDAPAWCELGPIYWRNALPDLTTVKQHAWGGHTQRGVAPLAEGRFYFKRFAVIGPRYLHKPPRARHTVVHQAELNALGFDTPRVVCLLERRCLGLLVGAAIVTRDLGDALSLNSIINRGEGTVVESRQDRRALLRALGTAIGRRHALGIFHGDLHLGNVFCRRDGDGFHFFWIDNEEGARFHRLPLRQRLHDLDHVNRFRHNVSLSERLLVWKAYAGAAGIPHVNERRIQRCVIRKSQRFWRKKGWL